MPKADAYSHMIGQRFNRLLVLQEAEPITYPSGQKQRKLLCRCDCGNEKIIAAHHILNDRIQSCGCFQREQTSKVKVTHGESRYGQTPEYTAWVNMIQRCYNPNHAQFKDWGGRGITVCRRWRRSFLAFLKDMGRKPSPDHSIDRIDNDWHYTPKNCRWATKVEQMNNRPNEHWKLRTRNRQTGRFL